MIGFLKGIRGHKFESESFNKVSICLHLCYFPFDNFPDDNKLCIWETIDSYL